MGTNDTIKARNNRLYQIILDIDDYFNCSTLRLFIILSLQGWFNSPPEVMETPKSYNPRGRRNRKAGITRSDRNSEKVLFTGPLNLFFPA